jgi:hypothetical protein
MKGSILETPVVLAAAEQSRSTPVLQGCQQGVCVKPINVRLNDHSKR